MPSKDSEDDDTGEVNVDHLSFSRAQVAYLQSEFERQGRWVTLLTEREVHLTKQLDQIESSMSFRLGLALTSPIRWIMRLRRRRKATRKSIDDAEVANLFPSGLLITPELLPEDGTRQSVDLFVQEILLSLLRRRVPVESIRILILEASTGLGDEELITGLDRLMGHLLKDENLDQQRKNFFVASLRVLAHRNAAGTIDFGERWLTSSGDTRAMRTLVQLTLQAGSFHRTIELLEGLPRDPWREERLGQLRRAIAVESEGIESGPRVNGYVPRPETVMYHAAQSMPHSTSGYSIRTHGLVKSMSGSGWNIEVILRHGYPLDRSDHDGGEVHASEAIDGVHYRFGTTDGMVLPENLIDYGDVFNFSRFIEYQKQSVESILSFAEEFRPAVIHSASNFVVGLAGAEAARRLGIPSIYEIRGFWHLTQSAKRRGYEFSDHFDLTERLEIETAKRSDHVFTITGALRDHLIEKGVDGTRISVLPNAVDATRFVPQDRDPALEASLELEDTVVIGYIGSFAEYEGLDLLLEAAARLRDMTTTKFHILLVGDGAMNGELHRMVRFLGLQEWVTFTGRISHQEVDRYYSLIDIMPLPRRGFRVCEQVSPLKPFEAMATGKMLVTSDVAALSEIVQHGETGLIHEKDNSSALADALLRGINDQDLRMRLGQNAREWVTENHDWNRISQLAIDVYNRLAEAS
jgi:glycosyltransferase involved in cell wall biosynthesis